MDKDSAIVKNENIDEIRDSHTNDMVPRKDLVKELLISYFSKVRVLADYDTIDIKDCEIRGESVEDHINNKEIVSGRAEAEIRNRLVNFNYEIYCGSNSGEFVYDELEVIRNDNQPVNR